MENEVCRLLLFVRRFSREWFLVICRLWSESMEVVLSELFGSEFTYS
jgi:hypothetical protein